MAGQNRTLVWLLRAIGTVDLTSLAFVFVPRRVFADLHQWLGLGELPREPIVGYLARNTSLWYAVYGLVLWFVSFDVQRYAALIRLLEAILVVQGLIMTGVPYVEGLPVWWTMTEGPSCIVMGLCLLYVQSRSSSALSRSDRAQS